MRGGGRRKEGRKMGKTNLEKVLEGSKGCERREREAKN